MNVSYFLQDKTIHALKDIDLTLKKGESIGFAGESGCGKTTLANAIMRTISPPGRLLNGKIILDDEIITELSDDLFNSKIRWKKISMIFQGAMNSLDPVYTIKNQIYTLLKDKTKNIDVKKIINTIESVGLNSSILNKFPHELSGGMKQRVIIAMSLLLNPEIIIADEPTTALDVLVQAQIINLLQKLKQEQNISILLITHDIALISELVDKICIMYSGQIIEFREVKDIINNPKHPYTQMLISSIPMINDTSNIRDDVQIYDNKISLPSNFIGCQFIKNCKHAMDVCNKAPPKIKTDNGYVKCWLY
ncbi:MAG: ABC transporter ATP-binding protein, partial [Nitrososphaeraceae archaeon]